jgi:hypothetical protein
MPVVDVIRDVPSREPSDNEASSSWSSDMSAFLFSTNEGIHLGIATMAGYEAFGRCHADGPILHHTAMSGQRRKSISSVP